MSWMGDQTSQRASEEVSDKTTVTKANPTGPATTPRSRRVWGYLKVAAQVAIAVAEEAERQKALQSGHSAAGKGHQASDSGQANKHAHEGANRGNDTAGESVKYDDRTPKIFPRA